MQFGKTCTRKFLKDAQIALVLRTRAILNAFQKLTRACFSQIALETILLPILISYLDKRYQNCKVNNVKSGRKKIECGVPQGSKLGPLLFLLYVNHLPNCLAHSKPNSFADDTNISTFSDCMNHT